LVLVHELEVRRDDRPQVGQEGAGTLRWLGRGTDGEEEKDDKAETNGTEAMLHFEPSAGAAAGAGSGLTLRILDRSRC
jgi:hypothetical protein